MVFYKDFAPLPQHDELLILIMSLFLKFLLCSEFSLTQLKYVFLKKKLPHIMLSIH